MTEEVDVVNEDLTNPTETESEQEVEVVQEETTPAPGDKTDSALLLESLKEERRKKKDLQDKVRILEEQISSSKTVESEIYSDEGKTLMGYIQKLESKLSDYEKDSYKQDVLMSYPILKDKWKEFEEFLLDPENSGMAVKTAAKAFLVENGIFTQKRKGLEKPTGGDKTPKPAGMTDEDKERLRKTDFKKYREMLKNGQI